MDQRNNMKLRLLTLKFTGDSADLEAPFQREYFRTSLPYNRIFFIIGVIFYSAFGILDALIMPEEKNTIWLIRFAIVDPIVIAVFLISFAKGFERYAYPLMIIIPIAAGGGIIAMVAIAPPPVSYSYYAGLLLVFILTYSCVRVPVLWASFAGWVVVILYEITAIWIRPIPFAILINNNFFFISANILGMISCYSMEYYARRDFFLTRQIEMDREEINNANQALEGEIAERRKAEEALRESEERYRTALESSNDGVAIIQDERYVYINDKYLNRFGVHTDAVKNGMPGKFVHPDDQDAVISYFNQCMQKRPKPDRLEIRMVFPDGTILYADVSMVRVTYGGKDAVLVYARDITRRKNAEKERERHILELQRALAEVKTLSGLLPICSSCKKIRDDKGYWNRLELYIGKHSDAQFSHGLCPDCARKLYPELYEDK